MRFYLSAWMLDTSISRYNIYFVNRFPGLYTPAVLWHGVTNCESWIWHNEWMNFEKNRHRNGFVEFGVISVTVGGQKNDRASSRKCEIWYANAAFWLFLFFPPFFLSRIWILKIINKILLQANGCVSSSSIILWFSFIYGICFCLWIQCAQIKIFCNYIVQPKVDESEKMNETRSHHTLSLTHTYLQPT